MYNIFETVMIYVYGFISIIVIAMIYSRIQNRTLYKVLYSKGKDYTKYKGQGFEVIKAVGTVVPYMFRDGAHIAMEVDGRYIPVDTVYNYGRFNQNCETEAKFFYLNGNLKFISYGDECLAKEVHKRFLITARLVFFSFIGVYILWYILLKISGSLPENWTPIVLSEYMAHRCLF